MVDWVPWREPGPNFSHCKHSEKIVKGQFVGHRPGQAFCLASMPSLHDFKINAKE